MFANKAFCIFVLMLFSFGIFASNGLANGCYGDESCLFCGQQKHHHGMDPQAGSIPDRCLPWAQGSPCGFENRQINDSSRFFISAVRPDNHESSCIPDTLTDEYGKDPFSKGLISPIRSSLKTGSPSIYLLNLSLLC
jgi:hypothetical protein